MASSEEAEDAESYLGPPASSVLVAAILARLLDRGDLAGALRSLHETSQLVTAGTLRPVQLQPCFAALTTVIAVCTPETTVDVAASLEALLCVTTRSAAELLRGTGAMDEGKLRSACTATAVLRSALEALTTASHVPRRVDEAPEKAARLDASVFGEKGSPTA